MPSIERAFRLPVEEGLSSIRPEQWADVYAVSFLIYDEEDDPRSPTLTVGFNTLTRWREQLLHASSDQEAKWNYAFWLQNSLVVLGEAGHESAEWVRQWVRDLGLDYSDEEEEADFDRCMKLGEEITIRFVAECCALAAAIHESGFVRELAGSPIPVLVHELEYHGEIADQNARANPSGQAEEFIAWIRSGCP